MFFPNLNSMRDLGGMFRDDEMMVKNEMRKNSFDDMMDGAMMMKYD